MTDEREEWLQGRQDGRVYPLGRALRNTYDAGNHDTLGHDVTGLMIDLSKVPYEPSRPPVIAAPVAAGRRSMLARIGDMLGWR